MHYTVKNNQEFIKILGTRDFEALKKFFSHPRTHHFVDINLRDALSGRTILHEAALADNLEIVAWLIKLGANIIVRDNDGQLAYDLASEPKVKELLSEGMLIDISLVSTIYLVLVGPGNTCTRLEGTLKKWTNIAGGFKERYFVLEEGIATFFLDL